MKKTLLIIGIFSIAIQACDKIEPPVYGCTDIIACNFNPEASINDESCFYDCVTGCVDSDAFNYNPLANIACDSINPSNTCCCYPDVPVCFENTADIVQKALIEDFTGHKCQNCPEAAEELHTIQSNYPNQVIGIAIHAGFFAEPNPGNAPFLTTDFRTEKGSTIHDFFGPQSYPVGLVNRRDYPNNHLKSYESWGAEVANIIIQSPKIGICIREACETISINLLALENLSEPHQLVVAVTEDKIIDWQTWVGQGNVENYEHNHVLRDIITPAFGDNIGAFSANETKSYTFSYQLNSNWVRSNCNIVAYVLNATTQEIIQVEEIHLTE